MQRSFHSSDTKSACPQLLTYVVQQLQRNNFCCGYDWNVGEGIAQ